MKKATELIEQGYRNARLDIYFHPETKDINVQTYNKQELGGISDIILHNILDGIVSIMKSKLTQQACKDLDIELEENKILNDEEKNKVNEYILAMAEINMNILEE
jgi:hypothetical protein